MGKKKVKPNAFTEFMFEFIDKERRAGRRYPKEQFSAIAKPHWEKLTEAQKDAYKLKAKSKPTHTVITPAKYSSQGIPLDDIARRNKEEFEQVKYMERTTRNLVEYGFQNNDIKTKPIHFIMANYFYKTHDVCYSPAEIAVGKFNLKDGLLKYYHTFVNPGSVKVGYAFEAKDYSERVHHLPPPPEAMGERDFDAIYTRILDVFGITADEKYEKGDSRRPCVFVRKLDIVMMESVLDQISFDMQWRSLFDLFELEILFNELKNAVDFDPEQPNRKLPISVTSYYIEQDRFDLTSGISCSFHEEEDATRHCSLSYIRRWFYIFADHVCERLDITLVPGTHLPANILLNNSHPNDNFWGDEAAGTSKRKREKDVEDTNAPEELFSIGYDKLEESTSSSDSD